MHWWTQQWVVATGVLQKLSKVGDGGESAIDDQPNELFQDWSLMWSIYIPGRNISTRLLTANRISSADLMKSGVKGNLRMAEFRFS